MRGLGETLGETRTRLANILVHFAYDGVYTLAEERVGGGGSLNLVRFVEDELGLDEESIS